MLKNENNPNLRSRSDNFHIYKTHREFIYNVNQTLNEEEFQFILKAKIIPMKNFKGAFVRYTYNYSQDIEKRLALNSDCEEKENIAICNRELSTIKETSNWIWMHPPRAKTLRILELAPFPEIHFDRNVWAGTLSIPKGSWGEWENSTFNWEFEVDTLKSDSDKYSKYYFVKSKSKSKFGTNINQYTFHKDSGFVEMAYSFEKLGKIHLKLLDIYDCNL